MIMIVVDLSSAWSFCSLLGHHGEEALVLPSRVRATFFKCTYLYMLFYCCPRIKILHIMHVNLAFFDIYVDRKGCLGCRDYSWPFLFVMVVSVHLLQ